MNGFADLRLNGVASQADDSFWPSFTDIMAVVVMIFLITTSVLILHNWELIQQITRTSEAEQRAIELAKETSEAKATVEEQLADARYRISILRLELLRSEQERQRRAAELARERDQTARLTASLKQLEARLAEQTRAREAVDAELQQLAAAQTVLRVQLDQEVRSKETLSEGLQKLATQFTDLQAQHQLSREQLARAQTALEQQQDRAEQLQARVQSTSTELAALRERAEAREVEVQTLRERAEARQVEVQTLRERAEARQVEVQTLRERAVAREAEMQTLRETATLVEARFADLVGEYDELKVKYDRLIKPARSPRGKYVVEVRYMRRGNEYRLSMREPDDAEYRSMELAELHQTLSSLRDRFPDDLYVRIIFPEQSGLSYAEAWGFTHDLLAKYDYYHRER